MGHQRTGNAAGKVSEIWRLPFYRRSLRLLCSAIRKFVHAVAISARHQSVCGLARAKAGERGPRCSRLGGPCGVAIATVAGSALMIDLRLLGSYAVEQPLKVVSMPSTAFLLDLEIDCQLILVGR